MTSRLSSLMATSARLHNQRNKDTGMPWWQQMLIIEAAKPVIGGVTGFVGEGAKQLFLGREATDLAQREGSIDNMFNAGNAKKELAKIQKRIRGANNEFSFFDGMNEKQDIAFKKDWIKNNGALTDNNNQFLYDNAYKEYVPFRDNYSEKAEAEFNELKKLTEGLVDDPKELKRRMKANRAWYSKTAGGKAFTGAKYFLDKDKNLEDFVALQRRNVFLGKSAALFDPNKDLGISIEDLYSRIQTGSPFDAAASVRKFSEHMKNHPERDKFYNPTYTSDQENRILINGEIQEMLKSTLNTNRNKYKYLSAFNVSDLTKQIGSALTPDMSVEAKQNTVKQSINSLYLNSLVPDAKKLQDNALQIVSPENYSQLISKTNNAIGLYTPGFAGSTNLRKDATDNALPYNDLLSKSQSDSTYDREVTRIEGKAKEVISRIASSFPEDFDRALNELNQEGIEMQTDFTKSSLSVQIYKKYLDEQVSKNVAGKTFIDEEFGIPIRTIDIIDKDYGTNLIKEILKKDGNSENVSSFSPAEIEDVKIKAENISAGTNNVAKLKAEGFKITNEDRITLNSMIKMGDLQRQLANQPTKENYVAVAKQLIDATYALAKQNKSVTGGFDTLNSTTQKYLFLTMEELEKITGVKNISESFRFDLINRKDAIKLEQEEKLRKLNMASKPNYSQVGY